MQDFAESETPALSPASVHDLWRQVEAYARETGDIDLDMVIAAIAASEGMPVEDAEQPWAAPPTNDS
ncbi:MAG: hypothetical protein Q7T26_09785 [Dehalococcoidia bacterium]|nr:hypothetical protein [Dehalococcoidia bacterium]